jgi:hypothetical protein
MKWAAAGCNFKYHFSRLALYRRPVAANRDESFGGSMAIKFLQTADRSDDSLRFQLIERLKVYLFGTIVATKFVGDVYRNRKERRARLNFIWDRNHQIRGALEGIAPTAHPAKNQQSIRVIREEVDRIEWALKEILPR